MGLSDLVENQIQQKADETAGETHPTLSIVNQGLFNIRASDRSRYWVASSAQPTERFRPQDRLGRDRLLVTEEIDAALREYLEALFSDVISAPPGGFLSFDKMREVLASDARQDLALGILATPRREVVVVIRGDLTRVVVPWSWFRPSGDGTTPEFGDVEVIDGGLTVRLGRYEAAVDAILYEFDREYRARERQRRLDVDPSFGAALRRLRLQKGVARSDFPGVSEKEVARIERGEVARPHGATLRRIADHLRVEAAEIETF